MHIMRINTGRSLLALCAGLVLTQAASALPMLGGAYENFDYPSGTDIVVGNNLAGGAGWNATGDSSLPNNASSRWADATALPTAAGAGRKVQYPTLSYIAAGYPTGH